MEASQSFDFAQNYATLLFFGNVLLMFYIVLCFSRNVKFLMSYTIVNIPPQQRLLLKCYATLLSFLNVMTYLS